MYSVCELSKVSICCPERVKGGGGVCEVLIQLIRNITSNMASFMMYGAGTKGKYWPSNKE